MKKPAKLIPFAALSLIAITSPPVGSAIAQNVPSGISENQSLAHNLLGTWILVGAPGQITEAPTKGGRLKFLTGNNWNITQADPESGVTVFHHGGTYTLSGDEYSETVSYANESTKTLINQTFKFSIKVEGDTLTQIGKGNPYTEVWQRVKPAPALEVASKTAGLEGWGKASDPAGDCLFKAENGKLTITVPGSAQAHDLSPELNSSTAPCALQHVSGDFTIEVKVEGEFQPGGESTQEGRTGYTGAGLVVFADQGNFVRLERATLQYEGDTGHAYTNFEIRVNGELERIGNTGDLPTEPNKPTWLKLERKGNQIRGAMSHDGQNWFEGTPKVLNAEAWTTSKLVAGVAAISTSRQTFSPVYSGFSLK